jgi:5-methylcytosine-specific restriction protein A
MPQRLRPPCSRPGCDQTKPCPTHGRDRRQRGTARQRGYGARHEDRFRRGVLDALPVCVTCRQAPATEADHWPRSRQQLEAQGLDADDPQYGRGLCHRCHSRSTAVEQPGGWNAERPATPQRSSRDSD